MHTRPTPASGALSLSDTTRPPCVCSACPSFPSPAPLLDDLDLRRHSAAWPGRLGETSCSRTRAPASRWIACRQPRRQALAATSPSTGAMPQPSPARTGTPADSDQETVQQPPAWPPATGLNSQLHLLDTRLPRHAHLERRRSGPECHLYPPPAPDSPDRPPPTHSRPELQRPQTPDRPRHPACHPHEYSRCRRRRLQTLPVASCAALRTTSACPGRRGRGRELVQPKSFQTRRLYRCTR